MPKYTNEFLTILHYVWLLQNDWEDIEDKEDIFKNLTFF